MNDIRAFSAGLLLHPDMGQWPSPDYGSDDLHNARLLGAYHVRKGWGDPAQTLRWVRSLNLGDERFIERYEKVGLVLGDWGRTKPGGLQSPDAALAGLGAAASRLAETFVELGADDGAYC